LTVDPLPQLALAIFTTTLPDTLEALVSPSWLLDLLRLDAAAPVRRSEELRAVIRDMLRHGGYKPTGRGKPASEYLLRAAGEGALRSINPVVDTCNVVSLHSGLPISVVDMQRLVEPLRVGTAAAGTRYVFNEAGQEIDVTGLPCLHDAAGPCANAVKDAQRTKTHGGTRSTLSLVWGTESAPAQLERATAWYRELLHRLGASTAEVTPQRRG
jgi:DNA/RNA-binding domain of Phe-tRNA-synthetase-like protein